MNGFVLALIAFLAIFGWLVFATLVGIVIGKAIKWAFGDSETEADTKFGTTKCNPLSDQQS